MCFPSTARLQTTTQYYGIWYSHEGSVGQENPFICGRWESVALSHSNNIPTFTGRQSVKRTTNKRTVWHVEAFINLPPDLELREYFPSEEWKRAYLILWHNVKMGVIVSKDNQKRTKKVQQTAAVVSALKLASKDTKGKNSPTTSQSLTTPTPLASHETKNDKLSIEDHDLKREHTSTPNLNYDKSSISYGLPELDAADSFGYSSGTTGYWDKTDKAIVSIPYFGAWRQRVENEELCSICSVYTGVEVHPCRVCCKVFHELCLKKKGKLYDRTELEAFRKANTEKGWSCHDCESLTSLLTDDEMQQLIENFDRLDVNQDTQINEDEYVRYKTSQYKDIHNENMPDYMEEEARNEFKQMDKDQTGTIDWWEFLNHEALKIISANRSKFQLVRMLSPLEIQKARDIFHAFDKDEDGYINSYEVAVGFTRWFGNLRVFDQDQRSRSGGSSFGRALDPKDVSGHIDRHSRIFMDADTDRNRLVSWDEYLREQALYILAARPNN